MAVLLYYSARRGEPFSEREKDVCWQTMARYGKEYPFAKRHDDMGAAFDLGDGIAFAGEVKIGGRTAQNKYDATLWWLKCLSEIRRAVPGCEWDVSLEEVPLLWEDEGGWRFPTDEEFDAMGL